MVNLIFLVIFGLNYVNSANGLGDFPASGSKDGYVFATCKIQPGVAALSGSINFRQRVGLLNPQHLEISVNITGFKKGFSNQHGLHVHTYGDLSGGCGSAGGHYNPFGTPHGAPTNNPWQRHVGDFGNVRENEKGGITVRFTDYLASLTGGYSIIGRAMVLHERADDLGVGNTAASRANGDAGPRLACCVIGLTDGRHFM